jgi:hypothetical protein
MCANVSSPFVLWNPSAHEQPKHSDTPHTPHTHPVHHTHHRKETPWWWRQGRAALGCPLPASLHPRTPPWTCWEGMEQTAAVPGQMQNWMEILHPPAAEQQQQEAVVVGVRVVRAGRGVGAKSSSSSRRPRQQQQQQVMRPRNLVSQQHHSNLSQCIYPGMWAAVAAAVASHPQQQQPAAVQPLQQQQQQQGPAAQARHLTLSANLQRGWVGWVLAGRRRLQLPCWVPTAATAAAAAAVVLSTGQQQQGRRGHLPRRRGLRYQPATKRLVGGMSRTSHCPPPRSDTWSGLSVELGVLSAQLRVLMLPVWSDLEHGNCCA